MARRGVGQGGNASTRRLSANAAKVMALVAAGWLATGCSMPMSNGDARLAAAPGKLQQVAEETPATSRKKPATYKLGNPYQVAGRWYHPREEPGYDEVGLASWYGDDFHGRQTANGEIYDMNGLTAAHPTLPMPSYARVTNVENGRSVVVRINDRGPFARERVIDLSKQTARILDFKRNGTAKVRVQYIGLAAADGDDRWLTTTVRHNGEPVSPSVMAASPPQAKADADESERVSALPAATREVWSGRTPTSGYLAIGHSNRVAEAFRLFDGVERYGVSTAFAAAAN